MILTGYHGRIGPTAPQDSPFLYITPDISYARDWATGIEGDGRIYSVTYVAHRPRAYLFADDFAADWLSSGASAVPGMFHPDVANHLPNWLRSRGYDAMVLPQELFDHACSDFVSHELWELVFGTYGDPQTVLFEPRRARAVRLTHVVV